jgi:hypothetical protein
MNDELPQLISASEQYREMLAELGKLIFAGAAEFATTWECANRVCDRYYLRQAA